MVPVDLKIISCDEYSEILEKGGPAPGGVIGKHKNCPKNAVHAQQIANGTYLTKNYFTNYSTKLWCVNSYLSLISDLKVC